MRYTKKDKSGKNILVFDEQRNAGVHYGISSKVSPHGVQCEPYTITGDAIDRFAAIEDMIEKWDARYGNAATVEGELLLVNGLIYRAGSFEVLFSHPGNEAYMKILPEEEAEKLF